MKGLVAIGFRVVHPVAQTVGVRLVYLRDGYIDAETFVRFFFRFAWLEDDADSQDIENFIERNMLGLHLVPNGVWRLDAGHDAVLDTHFVQLYTDRSGELFEQYVTICLGFLQQRFDVGIFFRMLVLETEIFQLSLDLVQTQAIGDRRINIESFTGNLVLLVRKHGTKGAHVVQTVSNLDEDDTNIIVHCQKKLLEVFGLSRSAVTENTA